jgi:hypothetical protein
MPHIRILDLYAKLDLACNIFVLIIVAATCLRAESPNILRLEFVAGWVALWD